VKCGLSWGTQVRIQVRRSTQLDISSRHWSVINSIQKQCHHSLIPISKNPCSTQGLYLIHYSRANPKQSPPQLPTPNKSRLYPKERGGKHHAYAQTHSNLKQKQSHLNTSSVAAMKIAPISQSASAAHSSPDNAPRYA
jgi:hypothetical protein